MISQSDFQARLSLYRYAVFAVTFTAFIVSLLCPVILTANPNFGNASLTFADVLVPSVFVAIAAALIGMMSYVIYAQLLKGNTEKRKVVFG